MGTSFSHAYKYAVGSTSIFFDTVYFGHTSYEVLHYHFVKHGHRRLCLHRISLSTGASASRSSWVAGQDRTEVSAARATPRLLPPLAPWPGACHAATGPLMEARRDRR